MPRKNARFHGIRATFGIEGIENSQIVSPFSGNFVTLSIDKDLQGENSSLREETFPLLPNREGPCGWLSEALATHVLLQERLDGGFPDDRDAAGPTLISNESLQEVARWFNLTIEEARRRFRMNLEVITQRDNDLNKEGAEVLSTTVQGPFWEDSLACPVASNNGMEVHAAEFFEPEYLPGDPRRFRIGTVLFQAAGVCRRCLVPERNSLTGDRNHLFYDQFEAFRMRRLPASVDASKWNHFYRLGVNTKLRGDPGAIETGQSVEVCPR